MTWFHIVALAISTVSSDGSMTSQDHTSKMDPNISFGACHGGGTPIVLSLSSGPRTYTGDLEGVVPSTSVAGDYCAGFVPTEPQFCVSIPAGGGTYAFEVTEAEQIDTVLVITGGPDGVCDDDGGNSLLSRLTYWFEAGQYQLYVGSYSQGNQAHFTLQVSASTW